MQRPPVPSREQPGLAAAKLVPLWRFLDSGLVKSCFCQEERVAASGGMPALWGPPTHSCVYSPGNLPRASETSVWAFSSCPALTLCPGRRWKGAH